MGNFHETARDVHLEGTILRATLRTRNGGENDSALNLDDILGNYNGMFAWQGENFSGSARDIQFSFEDDKPVLSAQLRTRDGEWRNAKINLSNHIENNNGRLDIDLEY